MALNNEEINRVVNGEDHPDPPVGTLPDDLLLFASEGMDPKDHIKFWASADIERLCRYLQLSMEELTPDAVDFHHMVAHQANDILPYLERKYELVKRSPIYDQDVHTSWHVTLQNVKRTLLHVRSESLPRSIQFDIEPPRKKSVRSGTEGPDRSARKAPKMPMRITLPFLEAINGLFTQQFEDSELSYVLYKITGYSQDNVSRHRIAMLSTDDRDDLVKALRKMIRSIESQ